MHRITKIIENKTHKRTHNYLVGNVFIYKVKLGKGSRTLAQVSRENCKWFTESRARYKVEPTTITGRLLASLKYQIAVY